VPRGEPPHTKSGKCVGFGRGEFAGRSFARGQYEYVWNDHNFRSQRSYGPQSPLRGTCSPPRGRVGVPPRGDTIDFANSHFSKWPGTSLIRFVLTHCRVVCSLSLLFFILQVGGV
jgi:hypothetical protein